MASCLDADIGAPEYDLVFIKHIGIRWRLLRQRLTLQSPLHHHDILRLLRRVGHPGVALHCNLCGDIIRHNSPGGLALLGITRPRHLREDGGLYGYTHLSKGIDDNIYTHIRCVYINISQKKENRNVYINNA